MGKWKIRPQTFLSFAARIEANALFDALRAGGTQLRGAEERLRGLGWRVSREPAHQRRVTRHKSRREANGQGVSQ